MEIKRSGTARNAVHISLQRLRRDPRAIKIFSADDPKASIPSMFNGGGRGGTYEHRGRTPRPAIRKGASRPMKKTVKAVLCAAAEAFSGKRRREVANDDLTPIEADILLSAAYHKGPQAINTYMAMRSGSTRYEDLIYDAVFHMETRGCLRTLPGQYSLRFGPTPKGLRAARRLTSACSTASTPTHTMCDHGSLTTGAHDLLPILQTHIRHGIIKT